MQKEIERLVKRAMKKMREELRAEVRAEVLETIRKEEEAAALQQHILEAREEVEAAVFEVSKPHLLKARV
jgi:hypothetical protein